MEGGLDRQVPPVLKQERERLIDRKNVLESSINRITKEFQSLREDLFQEETKPLDSFEFELRMDEYLGWVYDEQKGFRSKEGRSQDLRQWLNSTKARKWADTLFGDMFDCCRQYAWKVGHALENNSEGIEYLTNYLQCEFFISTITGTIGSGSGSGSRPLICDHSFQKRKSKMVNILNEGVYSNKKHNGCDWWVNPKERDRKKTKHKRENGTAAKKYFVDLYKKWSDRYFALYIMYKTQNKNGMVMVNPLLDSISFAKKNATKMKDGKIKIENKLKRKTETEVRSEIETAKLGEDNTENIPDEEYAVGNNSDDNNGNDNDDNDDHDNSSSDAPLIAMKMVKTKKEKKKDKTQEDCWQKLHQDNKELKENMDQMDSKIRQLTNFQDLEMSSLRKHLNVTNRRGGDAESKNVEYEERIRSIKDEMASSKQAQQSLLNELNVLRVRLEMLQNQSSSNVSGMINQNGTVFGYNSDISSQLFHRGFSNPVMPQSFPALHPMAPLSFPNPSFHNMFGFFGSNYNLNTNNNNISNLNLPPLITDNRHQLPLGSNDFNHLVDTGALFNSGNGFPKIDSINNSELRSVISTDTTFSWSHNDTLAQFSHSPADSMETMDVDL